MKAIKIILFTFIFSQLVSAQSFFPFPPHECNTYATDEWPNSRYTIEDISGDNVVTDNKTGLMWKQCAEGLTGADCGTGKIGNYRWNEALDLAATEEFADYTDWRVPNLKELESIIAYNCVYPAINETVFPNTSNFVYLVSSPVGLSPASNSNSVFVILFTVGDVGAVLRTQIGAPYLTTPYAVRLVRSGQ